MILPFVLAAALAQDADDARDEEIFAPSSDRDADVFGPSSDRDDEIFGTPTSDDARDDDIFGAPTSDDARADEIFGTPTPDRPALDRPLEPTTQGAIDRALQDAGERLTVGGRIWLQTQLSTREDTPVEDNALSAPNYLDVFLDGRPNDRVRAFTQGRLIYDWTVDDGELDMFGQERQRERVVLDQLWLRFDIRRDVFVTAGVQRIKWGSGRFWNPTDFLNQQVLNPLAVFDVRTGVSLVKVHVPFEKAGLNLYGVANLEGASTPGEVGGALRAEWLVGTTEIALSAAARRDQPLRLGADLSSAVGPLDVHIEGAVQHGVEAPFWEGRLDPATFTVPTAVDRADDWIPQVVAGLEMPIRIRDDAVYLGVEGFWNDAGYEDADLYPWLLAQGQFQPFYLGRAYGAAYLMLQAPGRWDETSFTLSALSNLSDRSGALRFDVRQTALRHLQLNAFVQGYVGDVGELRFALDLPPMPGLPDGLSIAPLLVDVGVGALVAF